MNFETYADKKVPLINTYIEDSIKRFQKSVSQRFSLLIESMQYSILGPGKRFRPLLVVATADFLGLPTEKVLPAACAVEFIHTYSLIHDDLPSLDNDDLRRGKPSSHKKYGEAVAILTGDAFLTEAFGEMLRLSKIGGFAPSHVLKAIELLVYHGGIRGMVGGQMLDVTTTAKTYSLPEVEFIHIHKTGSLILASVLIPAYLSAIEQSRIDRLKRFGEAIGLAFQIVDDLLDSESSARYSRGPRTKANPNYNEVMTPTEMKEKVNGLVDMAVSSLQDSGHQEAPLINLAEFIRRRNK